MGVDSNGCQNMFCAPLNINLHLPIATQGISAYPSPTTGSFTLKTTGRGQLKIYDAVGRRISSYDIAKDETQLQLPPYLSPGLYIGIFQTDQGTSTEVKIVYQP